MNFVKVALFALLLVALLVPVSTPSVSAGGIHRCEEHHTDYSVGCAANPENTRCGSFCFYAVCHRCTKAYHCEGHYHTHCNEDSCWDHCHRHEHHESPCTVWHWNIYGGLPDPGGIYPPGPVYDHEPDKRADEYRDHDKYEAPNLNDSLEFGMLPDDYVHPGSPCTVEEGDTSRGVTQLLPGRGLRPLVPASTSGVERTSDGYRITSLVDSHPSEITIGDLSHLPRTPGELGAPTLVSVTKVTDNSVTLQVGGGGRVQYRYWSYYGLREFSDDGLELLEVAPSEFRVPFHDLGGEIRINRGPGPSGEIFFDQGLQAPGRSGEIFVDRELQGVFSFQVRSLDAEGVSSGNSNILHEMIGMADFEAVRFDLWGELEPIRPPLRGELEFSLPLLTPPAWGTPMPPPGDGEAPRPVRPAIESVLQVPDRVRTVEVVLAANYSDAVEYRWWPHSGFLPTTAFDEWLPASGRRFVVPGVEPRIPGDVPYVPVVEGVPDVAAFNFQVRLVNADGIPGDPSDVKAFLVWGGDYKGWVTSQPMIPLPRR